MKILLAADAACHSRQAADLLKTFPFASRKTEVIVLAIVPTDAYSERPTRLLVQAGLRRQAENLARGQAAHLQDFGWTAQAVLREGLVAQSIIEAAEEFEADLVVMGSQESGARRGHLRSVSQQVLRYAPCSVLVARPERDDWPPHGSEQGNRFRILVAYDGSREARAAVETLASVPFQAGTEITILTVLPLIKHFRTDILQQTSPEWPGRQQAARHSLETVADMLRPTTPCIRVKLREGTDVSAEILKMADELDTDIIIVGHKEKNRIQRFLLGSVSKRIMRRARCSVWMLSAERRSKSTTPDVPLGEYFPDSIDRAS